MQIKTLNWIWAATVVATFFHVHLLRPAWGADIVPPKPEVLFYASFDKGFRADIANGVPDPIVTNGCNLVDGYVGKAAKLSAETLSKLVYSVPGNLNPERGSVSFWLKREWPEEFKGMRGLRRPTKDEVWRSFLCVPSSKGDAGDGTLHFWMWGPKCRIDRYDLGNRMGDGRIPYSGEWQFIVITWDDLESRCYVDGVPPVVGDSYSPQRKALRTKRMKFNREASDFKAFFVGCGGRGCGPIDGIVDDFKVWSRPLEDEEAWTLYASSLSVSISTDRSYGLDGERCNVRVSASSPRGLDLTGRTVDLLAEDGGVVWRSAPMPRMGGTFEAVLALPRGDYQFKVSEIESPDCGRFSVLRRSNPYEIASADADGTPGRMTLVESIRPDPDSLGKERFRSVGECRRGELGGVGYLEAGRYSGDRFAIRLRLDPSIPLYCLEVDYPDDADRTADMIVQRSMGGSEDYALQVGYCCGGEYRNSNRMLTRRYLYWQHDPDVTLIIMTAKANSPAAISEIRVFKIDDGALPVASLKEAAPVNGRHRHFGAYWEDPAIGYFEFGTDQMTLAGVESTIDRLAAYLKFTGRDTFVYPGSWYHGLIGRRYQPRKHPNNFLEAYYEKFDHEGLFVIPTLNRQTIVIPNGLVTKEAMADGSLHKTAISIFDTGKPSPGGWHGSPPNFCVFHPSVQEAIEQEVDTLIAEGIRHKSFKGICFHLTSITFPWWGGIEAGYNDYVIEAFEQDTGIVVPADRGDPLRAKAYAEWLKANAYRQWVQWRCDFITEFYGKIAGRLAKARPDLMLWINAMPQVHPEDPSFMNVDYRDRKLREAGIDPEGLSRRIPNLIMGTVAYPSRWRHMGPWQKFRDRDHAERYRLYNADAGYYSLFKNADYPWLNLHDDYWESPIGNGKGKELLSCDWLSECRWRVTCVNASGRDAMRLYALALKHNDILAFSRGGFLVGSYGMEPEMLEFARAFRRLPAVKFDTVAVSNPDITYRVKMVDGSWHCYAVNASDRSQIAVLNVPGRDGECVSVNFEPWQLKSDSDILRLPRLRR